MRARGRDRSPAVRGVAALKPLLAVLAASAGLRLLVFHHLPSADPLADGRALVGDSLYFHEWAAASARGEDFVGPHPYWQPPGYPLLLSLLYRAAGPAPGTAVALQHLLGLGILLLVHRLGRLLYDDRTALLATALASLYGPFVFFEGKLLSATAVASASLASLVLLSRGPTAARAFAAGLAGGAACALHPLSLLLVAALLAALASSRGDGRVRLSQCLSFAAGAALLVLPVTARNLAVSGRLVPVSANGGVNLFLGNNPQAGGSFRAPTGEWGSIFTQRENALARASAALGRAVDESEASRWFAGEAARWARENPGDFASLLLRKGAAAVSNFEFDALYLLPAEREAAALLEIPCLPFAALFSLATLGLTWRRPRAGSGAVLLAFMAASFAGSLLFFSYSRFRLPLAAAACPFAAEGVGAIGEAIRRRRVPIRALLFGCAALATSLLPLPDERRSNLAKGFVNLGNGARAVGRPDRAIAFFERSLGLVPGNAPALLGLGKVARESRDDARAERLLRQALAGAPAWVPALLELGELLAASRDPAVRDLAEASELLRRALRIEPARYEALYALGGTAFERAKDESEGSAGRAAALAEAERWFREATEAEPRRTAAWKGLAETLALLGRLDEAAEALARSRAARGASFLRDG